MHMVLGHLVSIVAELCPSDSALILGASVAAPLAVDPFAANVLEVAIVAVVAAIVVAAIVVAVAAIVAAPPEEHQHWLPS